MGQRFPITLRICRTISMRLVGHDLDVHFRVNAVHLLDKGFHFQIGGHKGDGFVRIRCFAGLGLAAAAGGQCCRGCQYAGRLQKRAAGELFHHNIVLAVS